MPLSEGTVSYSEMSAFVQCPLKHHLVYVADLVEPPERRSPGLALGTAFHAMLEARYRAFREADAENRPRSIPEARVRSWQALGDLVDSGRESLTGEQEDSLGWMLDGYDEAYGTDDDWEILDVERAVDSRLCRVGNRWISMRGRIDLLIRERSTGRRWLVDFKTMKGKDASGAAWGRERDLDWQFTLYQALLAREGLETQGAVYAAIRTDRLKREMDLPERYGRHLILRSPQSLERSLANAVSIVRHMAATQKIARPLPLFSAPDPQTCSWKCSYKEIHLHADSTGRDYAEVARDWGYGPRRRRDTSEGAS
jgi:hypothetical protein